MFSRRWAGAAVVSVVLGCVSLVLGPGTAGASVNQISAGEVIRGAAVEWGCTVTATGTVPVADRREPAVLSAGHCFGSTARHTGYTADPNSAVWGQWSDLSPAGRLLYSSEPVDVGNTDPAAAPDVAVIGLKSGVRTTDRLNHGVAQAHTGDKVCKLGRVSGATCGKVVSADADFLTVEINGFPGDSGSPLYNDAGALVGLLSCVDTDLTQRRSGGIPFVPGRSYMVFETINRAAVEAYRKTGFWLDGFGAPPVAR